LRSYSQGYTLRHTDCMQVQTYQSVCYNTIQMVLFRVACCQMRNNDSFGGRCYALSYKIIAAERRVLHRHREREHIILL
jgi:hypothetical protein